MFRLIPAFLVALLLTGCGTFGLIENQPQRIAGTYSVMPQRTWSRFRAPNAEIWTVDGIALQAIRFFNPIADGESLFYSRGDDKLPTYRNGMIAHEIQELVVDSFRRAGAQNVSPRALAPARFGAHDGFRFELDMLSSNGLELSGLVLGAVRKNRLYLISYTGTRAHYFPRYRQQVERLLASIALDA